MDRRKHIGAELNLAGLFLHGVLGIELQPFKSLCTCSIFVPALPVTYESLQRHEPMLLQSHPGLVPSGAADPRTLWRRWHHIPRRMVWSPFLCFNLCGQRHGDGFQHPINLPQHGFELGCDLQVEAAFCAHGLQYGTRGWSTSALFRGTMEALHPRLTITIDPLLPNRPAGQRPNRRARSPKRHQVSTNIATLPQLNEPSRTKVG